MKRFPYLPVIFCLTCLTGFPSCDDEKWPDPPVYSRDFKGDMRELVKSISQYGRSYNPSFIVVPQNGEPLVTEYGRHQDNPDLEYLAAIDGLGREDLFYGYFGVDERSPYFFSGDITGFFDKVMIYRKTILVTDYCYTPSKVDDSYLLNKNMGYVSYAAPSGELDQIPVYPVEPYAVNTGVIDSLFKIKNFLYLLQPDALGSKTSFLDAIAASNYDLVITDLYHNEDAFTPAEVEAMKLKKSGQRRLVIAYLSIGEAENYRYYWQQGWDSQPPAWMREENPDWEGNFKVEYWNTDWQAIILGNGSSYLKRIIDAGFDGVYLDIVDAFEYFEGLEEKR